MSDADLAEAKAAIQRVRELHTKVDRSQIHPSDPGGWCEECSDPWAGSFVPCPCPTIQALDGVSS